MAIENGSIRDCTSRLLWTTRHQNHCLRALASPRYMYGSSHSWACHTSDIQWSNFEYEPLNSLINSKGPSFFLIFFFLRFLLPTARNRSYSPASDPLQRSSPSPLLRFFIVHLSFSSFLLPLVSSPLSFSPYLYSNLQSSFTKDSFLLFIFLLVFFFYFYQFLLDLLSERGIYLD